MAKIIWERKAKTEFLAYVENAAIEFGASTANRWQTERKEIEWRLERYPTSYTPEVMLKRKAHFYRSCHLMNRRFKVIYYYDESDDVVHLVDIWDTKMNPKALVRRIK